MNILITIAFVASIAAFVLAYRAYKKVTLALSVINNPQSRTVTIDHTDGRITVVKEPYGTELPRTE